MKNTLNSFTSSTSENKQASYIHESEPIATAVVVDTTSSLNHDEEEVGVTTETARLPSTSHPNISSNNEARRLLGRLPILLEPYCPQCRTPNVRTQTVTFPSLTTWVLVALLTYWWWPIFWIPLVVDGLKTTQHMCTNCNQVVFTIKPMEDFCVKQRS